MFVSELCAPRSLDEHQPHDEHSRDEHEQLADVLFLFVFTRAGCGCKKLFFLNFKTKIFNNREFENLNARACGR
jgi:hypothetical protein